MNNKYSHRIISTEELSDNDNNISTTRWAFVTIVKWILRIIAFAVVSFVVAHLLDKPFDSSFFGGVATLVSIPLGIISVVKGLQGFETHSNDVDSKSNDSK